MRRTLSLYLLLFSLAAASSPADVFRFSYTQGEKYRILSRVHETVSVNGRFSHDSDILNKIAVSITDMRGNSGYHDVRFQTSERAYGSRATYHWSEEYASLFWRDGRGAYAIDPSQFMPVVRDVPLFPVEDVQPGQSWAAQGSEVYDLRRNFGIESPFRFPITANYTYMRNKERSGIDCAVFGIRYEVFHDVPSAPRTAGMYPTRISGYSTQEYSGCRFE